MTSSSSSSTCSSLQSPLTGRSMTLPQQPVSSATTDLERIEKERADKKCVLCKTTTVDEVNLGCLYSRDGVTCHYFCLLFCSNLVQHGVNDSDGILCFLPNDITKEVNRVHLKNRNLNFYKCRYCKEPGATIGCCIKTCKVIFHFPCGLANGANFRFTSRFLAYCKEHSDTELPKLILGRRANLNSSTCAICSDPFPVERNAQNYPVVGRCRLHCDFYHKYCIQNYALSAGCMFKCPICAEKKQFKADVRVQGIFVPHRDASWEKEPGAFEDLQRVHSRCDAKPCTCPLGREHLQKNIDSKWRMLRCNNCAAVATHVACCKDSLECATACWLCPDCSKVERKFKNRSEVETATITITISDDSSDISDDNSNRQAPVNAPSSNSSCSVTSPVRAGRTVEREREMSPQQSTSDSSSDSSNLFIPVVRKQRKRYNRRRFRSQNDSDTDANNVQDSDDKNETDNQKKKVRDRRIECAAQTNKSSEDDTKREDRRIECAAQTNKSSEDDTKRANHDNPVIVLTISSSDDEHKELGRSSSEESLFIPVRRCKKRKRREIPSRTSSLLSV